MSDPFIAEIIMFGGNFAPRGWAHCDGQILPISQNQALFSLLGTTYGGDGRTTFGLPDLRGRVPTHPGPLDGVGGDPNVLGKKGGSEAVMLTESQVAAHHHPVLASSDAGISGPLAGNVHAKPSNLSKIYADPNNLQPMSDTGVGNTGAGQGHDNMQPYLTLCFIIALQGVFPSRN